MSDLPVVGAPLGEWRFDAACAGEPIDTFYPGSGRRPTRALRICRGCPVQAECLAYALDHHQHWGVWGGMTERQRWAYKRQRAATGSEDATE